MQTATLTERLATFEGYWEGHEATARQLAAIGHVYDRPPLEALEEGSRCVQCSLFVRRATSVQILQGALSALSSVMVDNITEIGLYFHHPSCTRLQTRIPLDLHAGYSGVYRMGALRDLYEQQRRSRPKAVPTSSGSTATASAARQQSPLFWLPTELRLQIYAMVLPAMDSVTPIVPLNRESGRIVTLMGAQKTGPRDMTKTNLLCACRTIHEEALDLLYSNITYSFRCTKDLYLFMRHIGVHGRRLLTSIDILCACREDAIAFALLATCERLCKITIRFPRPSLLFKRAPLWAIEGVASLLELSGLADVRFGRCSTPMYLLEHSADAALVRCRLSRPREQLRVDN